MTSGDLTIDLSENKTRSNYDYNFDRLSNVVYRIRLSLFASEIEMGVEINALPFRLPATAWSKIPWQKWMYGTKIPQDPR